MSKIPQGSSNSECRCIFIFAMKTMQEDMAVSILLDAYLQKKLSTCHCKLVQEAKRLHLLKRDIEGCLERLVIIRAQLRAEDDATATQGPETESSASERDQEHQLMADITDALKITKATIRALVRRKAALTKSRASLHNRQRRLVERAYRSGTFVSFAS
ncbi:hypothetical protein SDRG_04825 [Saprolegnia diclina VS20]|uniref:Uncharacterized protein n=1 Tax=Saprolegnia diclina (strain VS20) TaxID=1156394 RepID=T0QSW4_SAPDV|nr:hypothetical protein SDRG_04825 [Saprolegnia diclina VS20]EQC37801.1 hypothetical protein SDRG_04825 [Saprolegnia diclina VS20]|eukprot:XP_008608734.1 hypothetical protein SDRG_04825 [Saprolegnia diclina VS20]